jgi:antitoxin VapB
MNAHRTKVFKSGNSLAVRLPKDIAFAEGAEVELTRRGDVVTVRPTKIGLEEMWSRLTALPKPSAVEERDLDEIPERPGL